MSEQVGVIEFPGRYLFSTTLANLENLLGLGCRGRVVGWGIWREMNLALRDLTPGEASHLSQELPLIWRGFTIRQSGKVRWSIERDGRRVVIWDLWNWVKRPPRQGETARALYLAIKSAGDKMGVSPRGFYGNGNLASPLLRAHNVEDHMPDRGLGIEEFAAKAFFGGRIQSVRIGAHRGPVYEYDLNSAYAWGLSQLPEITGSSVCWKSDDWKHDDWSLIEVEWNIPRQKAPIYPFPVRSSGGKVEYPRCGRGWQWSPLYVEAKRHWPKSLKMHNAITLDTTDRKPFAFVNDLYESRQAMANPLEAAVAKWTLSALWGKLCQRPHGRPERQSYRSLAWAGMATSLVNAELLRVAMKEPSAVWSFGVDSLVSSSAMSVYLGTGLGEWKEAQYREIEAYQPGFWRMLRSDGTWKEKSRGVPEGTFDWEEGASEWRKYGSFGRVPVSWTEFVGISSFDQSLSLSNWLTEKKIESLVLLRPGGVKGLRDFQRAGAGGTRTWEPPDRITDTEEFGVGYGLDHSANAEQEVLF